MDEQERDYLKQQIQDLERSNGRWKLGTFTLAAVLVLLLAVSGGSSLVMLQRQAAMVQRALVEQEMARAQAEQAARQLRQAQDKNTVTKER
jgi:RecA/RadA recombinase